MYRAFLKQLTIKIKNLLVINFFNKSIIVIIYNFNKVIWFVFINKIYISITLNRYINISNIYNSKLYKRILILLLMALSSPKSIIKIFE